MQQDVAEALALVGGPFGLGRVVSSDGVDFIVVSAYSDGSRRLCRIPNGMTALDLGRRFWHDPSPGDATRFTLTSPWH